MHQFCDCCICFVQIFLDEWRSTIQAQLIPDKRSSFTTSTNPSSTRRPLLVHDKLSPGLAWDKHEFPPISNHSIISQWAPATKRWWFLFHNKPWVLPNGKENENEFMGSPAHVTATCFLFPRNEM
jgi:hypothetical protein